MLVVAVGTKRFSAKLFPPPAPDLSCGRGGRPGRVFDANERRGGPAHHGSRRPGGSGAKFVRPCPCASSPSYRVGLRPGPVARVPCTVKTLRPDLGVRARAVNHVRLAPRQREPRRFSSGVAVSRSRRKAVTSSSLSPENLGGRRDMASGRGPRLRGCRPRPSARSPPWWGHSGDSWHRAVGPRDLALISNGWMVSGHAKMVAPRSR